MTTQEESTMPKNRHVYQLTQQRINIILGNLLKCNRCGRQLKHGETIYSKKSSNHRTNYWCLACAIETKQYGQ